MFVEQWPFQAGQDFLVPPTQGNTIRQEAEGPLLTGLPLGKLRLICSVAGRSGLGSGGPDFKWKHGPATAHPLSSLSLVL